MTKIISQIETSYPKLTASDKLIADFVQKKFDQIPFYTIHQLAAAIEASPTTISRFVKKLGYKSYRDFKYEIIKSTTHENNYAEQIYDPVSALDSEEEIINKVFQNYSEDLRRTLDLLDNQDLMNIAKIFVKANRIIFLGIGGSGYIAHLAAQRFVHLGLQAEAFNDEYHIVLQTLRVNTNDVVVGISHSGRSRLTVEGLERAREKGATTVGISNYVVEKMSENCDFLLNTAFKESKVKAAAISSYILQMCIIETLYLLVAKYEKKLWDLDQLNHQIEKNTKIKL
jgi:DNA-binding MurR/RpiR family transcriptional regulator